MRTLDPTAFPALLRQIFDPPKRLWARGQDLKPDGVYVALVGTRRSSRYGEQVAARLAGDLARRGVWVVSGLARGIDAAAHRGALDAGGKTVAVLGAGVDVIYPPEHRELAERIERSGALVSEFPPGRQPARFTFVRRNRIVAGMAVATVVVESDLNGGGMITADFACEEGRTVGAVPGRVDQPTARGCHQLIREGALLVTGADDLVAELGFPVPTAITGASTGTGAGRRPVSSREQSAILGVLRGGEALPLDAIVGRTGLPTARVAATVLLLEIEGVVRKRQDGCYES